MSTVEKYIRSIPDFPGTGNYFRDIINSNTGILKDYS